MVVKKTIMAKILVLCKGMEKLPRQKYNRSIVKVFAAGVEGA